MPYRYSSLHWSLHGRNRKHSNSFPWLRPSNNSCVNFHQQQQLTHQCQNKPLSIVRKSSQLWGSSQSSTAPQGWMPWWWQAAPEPSQSSFLARDPQVSTTDLQFCCSSCPCSQIAAQSRLHHHLRPHSCLYTLPSLCCLSKACCCPLLCCKNRCWNALFLSPSLPTPTAIKTWFISKQEEKVIHLTWIHDFLG